MLDNKRGHRQRAISKFEKILDLSYCKLMYTYELLEILLFFVHKRKDTKNLAKELINKFRSVNRIFTADEIELTSIKGIGKQTFILFKVIQELISRSYLERMCEERQFNSLQHVINYCRFCMASLKNEQLRMLCLNKRNFLISDLIICDGGIDSVKMDIKKLVQTALSLHSSAIILAHNHPSGSVYPSDADIELTIKIRKIADALDIKLHDHIIITNNSYFSMREMNII